MDGKTRNRYTRETRCRDGNKLVEKSATREDRTEFLMNGGEPMDLGITNVHKNHLNKRESTKRTKN